MPSRLRGVDQLDGGAEIHRLLALRPAARSRARGEHDRVGALDERREVVLGLHVADHRLGAARLQVGRVLRVADHAAHPLAAPAQELLAAATRSDHALLRPPRPWRQSTPRCRDVADRATRVGLEDHAARRHAVRPANPRPRRPRRRGGRPGARAHPGEKAVWTEADKDGFGTATSLRSETWLTLDDGRLTEVYYPDLGTPALRDLQLVVSDGRTFTRARAGRDRAARAPARLRRASPTGRSTPTATGSTGSSRPTRPTRRAAACSCTSSSARSRGARSACTCCTTPRSRTTATTTRAPRAPAASSPGTPPRPARCLPTRASGAPRAASSARATAGRTSPPTTA